jgi:hypothetical protein
VVLAALGALVVLLGDEKEEAPLPPPPPPKPALATGLHDRNVNLLRTEPGAAAFEPARERTEALRPRYYRLLVDWAQLQPEGPEEPPRFAQLDNGCLRDLPPCAPFDGMRDVLRAVRAQQDKHGGWEVLVSIYGVPEWAAAAPHGCERDEELPRSRPLRPDALPAYRRLIRSVVDLARSEGVELRWWAPWNEPNQPYFISPQRARCDPGSRSLAVGVYTRLVRALRAELPDARLVLGELAATRRPTPRVTDVEEFVAGLPDDVACAGDVWAQHQYAERGAEAGVQDAVARLRRALERRPCTSGRPIWVTETGVGGTHVGAQRSLSAAELAADCETLAGLLRHWADDPGVDVAFQFSLREDIAFPVGLFDTGLTRAFPVYDLWRGLADGRVRCPA